MAPSNRTSVEEFLAAALVVGRKGLVPAVLKLAAHAADLDAFVDEMSAMFTVYDERVAATRLMGEGDKMRDDGRARLVLVQKLCHHPDYVSEYNGVETISTCVACGG